MVDLKIGFIGLGIMGESMCENIIKKGNYPTWVYDLNKTQIDKMVAIGAKPCKNINEIAENVNVIIMMVPTSENSREVITGLLPHMQKNTILIFGQPAKQQLQSKSERAEHIT